MLFNIQCPTCAATLQIPDELAGQVVKCSNCETMLQLPPAEALAAAAAPPASPPPPPPPPPAQFEMPQQESAPFEMPQQAVSEPPAAAPPAREVRAEQTPRARRGQRPAAKQKSKLPLILGGVAAALIVFCGGGCAGLYFFVIAPAQQKVEEFGDNLKKDLDEQNSGSGSSVAGTLTVDQLSERATKLKGSTVTVRGKIIKRENTRDGGTITLESGRVKRIIKLSFDDDAWKNDEIVVGNTIEVSGKVNSVVGSSIGLTDCEVAH